MGIERETCLIVGGKIFRVWHRAKVPGPVDDVLDAVRGL